MKNEFEQDIDAKSGGVVTGTAQAGSCCAPTCCSPAEATDAVAPNREDVE